jgi:hypothetical protein
MIFEPEKIAPHGSLGGSIPRIDVYKGNLRALDALVASELPQLTFKSTISVFKKTFLVYIHIF